MEIIVLGSGSTGNATLVRSGGVTILLEAGLSARQIATRARLAGFDPARISALFVSHAHADHIRGASVFSRRHRVPAFLPEAAWEAWLRGADAGRAGRIGLAGDGRAAFLRGKRAARGGIRPGPRDFYARPQLEEGAVVEIGRLCVRSFPVPHDADGTIGFVVEAEGMRFGYVTDLGHVTHLVVERLRGCDALLIEMNHDPDLLREGPYPWSVKQRIASRHGHLSNEQGALLLEHAMGSDTRVILLGHLSETNNLPAIALSCARLAVERSGRGDIQVLPAEAHRPSKAVRL
jgi:phosphoribosyl 1,2-cyclic phosphodiesterase